MKTISSVAFNTSEEILSFAKKNYEIYVKHYKSRNLEPMPLNEFLKNYAS